jgi:flagellar basal body-associated protein FliL
MFNRDGECIRAASVYPADVLGLKVEKQPSRNERTHHRPKHLHWIILAAFLLLTFLAVVITGAVAFANDTKNNNRHQIFDPLSPNVDNLNPDGRSLLIVLQYAT